MTIKSMLYRFRYTALALVMASQCATSADPVAVDSELAPVPGWQEFVEGLAVLPTQLLSALPAEMRKDPQIQQEVARLVLQALTTTSIATIGSYGDHPAFLPSIGELLNVGQPNADTTYRTAQITPGGVYRLRGKRGSLTMAVIGQVGAAPGDKGSDGEHPGATRNYLELGSLKVDADDHFDVLLSTEKPADYEGDWWQLHPQTYRLLLRLVSGDWVAEQDPTLSIERVDIPVRKMRTEAAELEDRLRRIPQFTAFLAGMFIDHVEKLNQAGFVNRLKVLDVSQTGGLDGQFYYEGIYDLEEGEALLLEVKQPLRCEYQSIILTTDLYQTSDWYNNQSSLNASQSTTDSDGMLRVVIAGEDPGVANWLDTAGYARGVVQGRWTHCDSQPVPSAQKVALSELSHYLPADTPQVSAKEREKIIRDRRAAYQQRPHW